ncbi:uncharacterized protein LOC129907073 [Episyrphus balteatus]|uniref:uncharacterized protein LOC129907073 n=1 Tax=Episyrphus balteatus TaxID=286459 RepID=UPI0024864BF2|nr:uncharacterized protein LOC129907073 [Episyrphus balteatus]
MAKWLDFFCLLAWILAAVNGQQYNLAKFPNRILKEGESCQIKTGGPGVCTLLTSCEVYLEALKTESIEYSSIVRCSFKGQDEVICCPLKTTEELFPGTFKGVEEVSEGPTEELIETSLMAGGNNYIQNISGQSLKVGASCNAKTGEPGVCKLLSACEVYLEGLQKEIIEYSSINICSFMGQDEVICCPNNNLPANHKTLGHIPTEPPRMPRPPFTGTIPRQNNTKVERPFQKILKVGSICQTKIGEPGVCKLLIACGVYYEGLKKQTIEYSSIAICTFIVQDEVICCPNNSLPTNHNTLGHIPKETPIRPIPPFAGTIPSQNNNGFGKPKRILKSGSICQTKTGEPGVCKLLSACGVYSEGLKRQTIAYSSIAICIYNNWQNEVVCCPYYETPSYPQSTTEFIASGPINVPETVTEGPIEQPALLEKVLTAGSICKTKTGEPGICKLLSACGVYLEGLQKEIIEYSSINICSFIGKDEVVCCPNNYNPRNHPKTSGYIPTQPFNAPETVTEGPIEQPAVLEKVLTAGSICKTKTGEPGICKLLSACGVYLEGLQKEIIEYSSINICSFIGKDEVVCCPNNYNPRNHPKTSGYIPTQPFIAPETVTEGPIEQPAVLEKVLTAGSICKTKTGEPGICQLLSACGVYLEGLQKEIIEYSSINICSFIGKDEVVCCPNNHHRPGHIPTAPSRMPRPPLTEIGRPEKNLKSGSICKTKTGEPGICKLLSACGVYLEGLQKETIEYSSIFTCSFMDKDEVICYPNNDAIGHISTQTPKTKVRFGTLPSSQNSSEVNRPAVTGFSKNIKRLDIFNIWLKVKERSNAAKHHHVWRIFKNTYQIKSDQVRNRIVKLCNAIRRKWNKSSRNESIFLSKNNHWLNTVEVFTSVHGPNNQVRSKKTVKKLLDSYDAEKIIAMAGLSKEQYQIINNIVNQITEVELFPSYDTVQREKSNRNTNIR